MGADTATFQGGDPAAVQAPLDGSAAAPAPRTLIDILRASARAHPDASAIVDPDGAMSYAELMSVVAGAAARLREHGVRRGDRVGVRMPSGSRHLYLAILAVLAAGAAYVPVDADDPEERARLVFGEAKVRGVVTGRGVYTPDGESEPRPGGLFADPEDADDPDEAGAAPGPVPLDDPPALDDDAWIIFTSGSTGTPKGVAVTHRSAAGFVDAEAALFLQDDPIGPGDRVLAGLSVAFDASCEEMWLAWRHAACLAPAPRSLVRSGMDLGPWLIQHSISIVSTVPTLAALWPSETLENVRMLIFGGEAVPPELAERLAADDRELWNTYGPTEATVVACAAPLLPGEPVRIGLPLDGWRLWVVDAEGHPVAEGEQGELIIGGIGLARYLDPAKDAEKYAPMPTLGLDRAYRSGDLVRYEPEGLVFLGRADDQVKIGGRRIELGEIESALQRLDGVSAAAVTVQEAAGGGKLLVGYLSPTDPERFDREAAIARLREELPAPLVPLLAVLDELPVRVSGKVDKKALPWPIEGMGGDLDALDLSPAERWLAELWQDVLGMPITSVDDNFFDLGGGSLAAAQLVSAIRTRVPAFTVADIYALPRLGMMAEAMPELDEDAAPRDDYHRSSPVPLRQRWLQTLLSVPLMALAGARWLVYLLTASTVLHALGGPGAFAALPTVEPVLLVLGLLLFGTPFGRMGISIVAARLLLHGVKPGDYPRGGQVHLRLWLAEQIGQQVGAVNLAGAPWITAYARGLGATIGRDATLHSLPPVTGMLTLGEDASIEPEVDLHGSWIDGDLVRIGEIRVGRGAVVGTRSTLLPGARIGRGAEIAPGSAVFGKVPSMQRWAGSPAARAGRADPWWPDEPPPRGRIWSLAYAASSITFSLLPLVAAVVGALPFLLEIRSAAGLGEVARAALVWLVPGTVLTGLVLAGAVVVLVRLLSIGLREGIAPVRGRIGWQVWSIERLLDLARTILFPIYSSMFTPVWLRMLGARVGRNVEASTVLLLPSFTTIRDGAFLADDTMVAGYELGGGWVRIAPAEIGKRAFLGNSGIAPAGHRVPKNALVAVLSTAPRKAKSGSSWLGSPAVRLRRQRNEADLERTYDPPLRLRIARVSWELCRFVPVVVTMAIAAAVLLALAALVELIGPGWTLLASGAVMVAAGAVAAAVSTLAKWLLVGRIVPGEHPLWSSFIWRTEVSDTFTEMVAAPWFAGNAAGTPALAWWLRSLGARVGRGVWCDTYWLPEADLVTLEDGATVNRGCVLQTHLFHDRVMSVDGVAVEAGATLGPHSVILPAARIGAHATVGPASLIMRGETVPVGSRWSGNPIGPWSEVRTRVYQAAPDGA